VPTRVPVPVRFAPAEPQLAAGDQMAAARPPAAQSTEAMLMDRAASAPDVRKPDQTPRVAKKKARSATAVQVYELPDGRHVTVRRATRNAYGYAAGSGFEPWDNSFASRANRRVHVARPGLFDGPF
jgi:hypothetical protein